MLIHRLMQEHHLIERVSDSYLRGKFSKLYRLGKNHPKYTGKELSVWDKM